MTIEQLKSVMKYQLSNFNDEEVEISNLTVHNAVLKTDDGFGHINSVYLYYNAIRWSLNRYGHILKEWPTNWLNLNVNELSTLII